MLGFGRTISKNCQGMTRRDVLQVGGLSLAGMSLADALRRKEASADDLSDSADRSCIFIWLNGGPSQFETFDPKPNTDDSIRSPYGAINTSVPGVQISELLPMLARRLDKYAVIRSMSHKNGSHGSTAMLTGFDDKREAFGAVVTKLIGAGRAMPP